MPLLAVLVFWLTLLFMSLDYSFVPIQWWWLAIRFCPGGVLCDLPDPRNVPALQGIDSGV
jgi:hypothetical protein